MTMLAVLLFKVQLWIPHSGISTAFVLGLAALSAAIGYFYPLPLKTVAFAALVQPLLSIAFFQAYEYLRLLGRPAEVSVAEALVEGLLIGKVVYFWSAALFYSGAWLGKWVRGVRYGKPGLSHVSVGLAEKLITHRRTESDDAFDNRVKRWSSVISGAAPILIFLASLVSSELVYLGALARVPGSN
jgi:hypothetical protein